MMKKPQKQKNTDSSKSPTDQGDCYEANERQGIVDAIVRDLHGLEQLQQYQRTLIKEVRQNLQALHATSPS